MLKSSVSAAGSSSPKKKLIDEKQKEEWEATMTYLHCHALEDLKRQIQQLEEMNQKLKKLNQSYAQKLNMPKEKNIKFEHPIPTLLFSIGDKTYFLKGGAMSSDEFGEMNADIIPSLEEAVQEQHKEWDANKLKQDLRAYSSQSIRELLKYQKISSSKKLEKYGIDIYSIARRLGPCPGKEYEIDHIKPLSAFDFKDSEQIKMAFSPENHQWLKKTDNLKKSDEWEQNGRKAKGKTWV